MATEKRLIDVEAAIERAKKSDNIVGSSIWETSEVVMFLEDEPAVDAVEVVHGRWREKILVGGFAEEWGYVCSECGCTVSDRSNLSFGRFASINQRLNYCPNCGADMRERRNND